MGDLGGRPHVARVHGHVVESCRIGGRTRRARARSWCGSKLRSLSSALIVPWRARRAPPRCSCRPHAPVPREHGQSGQRSSITPVRAATAPLGVTSAGAPPRSDAPGSRRCAQDGRPGWRESCGPRHGRRRQSIRCRPRGRVSGCDEDALRRAALVDARGIARSLPSGITMKRHGWSLLLQPDQLAPSEKLETALRDWLIVSSRTCRVRSRGPTRTLGAAPHARGAPPTCRVTRSSMCSCPHGTSRAPDGPCPQGPSGGNHRRE